MSFRTEGETDEYVFIQYMECNNPVEKVDSLLSCICLKCSTNSKVDHMIEGQANPVPGKRLRAGD